MQEGNSKLGIRPWVLGLKFRVPSTKFRVCIMIEEVRGPMSEVQCRKLGFGIRIIRRRPFIKKSALGS